MNGPTETPQQAARRLAASAIRDGYKPEALHTYTYPDGSPWYWRIRLKNPHTGEKWIRPMRLNGAGLELGEPAFPNGKPLYRLHDLTARPDHRVIVVEGEWCTDRLADRGLLTTTSGAADSAAKADWRPLAGRDVTIWPDNHEAGQRYATDAAERLLALSCTVRVIDVEKLGLPNKGDAVDWLKAKPAATAAEIEALPCVEARQRGRPGNGASPARVCGGGEASMAGEDSPRPFPVLSEKAGYGIFGEIVELGTRNSEADPAAVLMTALTFAAATIGTEPHTWVGDTRHHARLYSVLVGASSRARKGTSRDPVQRIFLEAQRVLRRKPELPFPFGNDLAITPGPLSSGEGLVYAVRDASDALDKDGQPIDSGVEDKRLLVVDGEFGAALKAAQRQGNTLSAILRSGWDYGNIAPLTKSNRIKASGAHINFVAHITLEELHALLESVDLWNGFANRILWTAVRRTGQVAHPSRIPDKELAEVAEKVATALLTASKHKEISFTVKAADLWSGLYPDLTQEHSGAFGAVTSRGEAQVRRIALLYAALDTEASAIDVSHLRAAIAAWDYCLASARYVFGGAEVDPDANKLLAALGERDMTLTDINGLFSGHKSKGAINALLTRLQIAGRVTLREEGGGRDGRAKTTVTLRK